MERINFTPHQKDLVSSLVNQLTLLRDRAAFVQDTLTKLLHCIVADAGHTDKQWTIAEDWSGLIETPPATPISTSEG